MGAGTAVADGADPTGAAEADGSDPIGAAEADGSDPPGTGAAVADGFDPPGTGAAEADAFDPPGTGAAVADGFDPPGTGAAVADGAGLGVEVAEAASAAHRPRPALAATAEIAMPRTRRRLSRVISALAFREDGAATPRPVAEPAGSRPLNAPRPSTGDGAAGVTCFTGSDRHLTPPAVRIPLVGPTR